jgi:hypothetical protein
VILAIVASEFMDTGGGVYYPPPTPPPEKPSYSEPGSTIKEKGYSEPEPTVKEKGYSKPESAIKDKGYAKPESTGKETGYAKPESTREEPPSYVPPPPPLSNLTGSWVYSVAPTNVNGRMSISGSDDQLQIDCMADYFGIGADGFTHRIIEEYVFAGSLNGNVLFAECLRGTYRVDGFYGQPPLPAHINLQVSPDRRFMTGSVQNRLGWGTVTARKQ